MMLRNHLHALTCLVLPLTIAAALWTRAVEEQYSRPQLRRAQVGFPGRVMHASVAMGLATNPAEFRAIFDDPNGQDSADDRKAAHDGLRRDYALITGYTLLLTLLGCRTWLPGSTCPRRLRHALVVLPLLVGVCDLAENLGAEHALATYLSLSPGTVQWTAVASRAKWLLTFLDLALLGWAMLGLKRHPVIGAFLREFAGLILLTAGMVGLLACGFPSMIPSAFHFGCMALLPIGLMLFFRDHLWNAPFRLRDLVHPPQPEPEPASETPRALE
jgi:hypothetical protein